MSLPPFSLEHARRLDHEDPLSRMRQQFLVPRHGDGDLVYLCGNSLGLQPRAVRGALEEVLADWETLAVEGHFAARRSWMAYHELLAPSGERLVGALPGEVVFMNSLSVNLHLMMVSFFRPQGNRTRILVEGGAFPSDQYAVDSQLRFHGLDPAQHKVELRPRPGEDTLRRETVWPWCCWAE